jgi:hypothetical protein
VDLTADRLAPRALTVGWAALPFVAGPALGAALAPHGEAVSLDGAVLLWSGWAVALVATLVAHPVSLTVVRVAAPAALAAVVAAAIDNELSTMALAWCVLVLVNAFAPEVGRHHVNGPAYPNERRHLLRIPGALSLGPLPLAWIFAVVVPAAGSLLLTAGEPVGVGAIVIGMGAAPFLFRSMHRLSRRWLVFVPAGVVVHDHLALADPVLFLRQSIESIAPAPSDTDATDLTVGALGLALQITLAEDTSLGRVVRGRSYGEEARATAVLVTPTRPGAVLREAADRRIRVAP